MRNQYLVRVFSKKRIKKVMSDISQDFRKILGRAKI